MTFNVLILGGTQEGRTLAERLAPDARYDALLSFAGRTANVCKRRACDITWEASAAAPWLAAVPATAARPTALIDATHPFAAQMSSHAVSACEVTHTPLIRLERPAWFATEADQWLEVPDMSAAAAALGAVPRRVFLSVGRLEIAAFSAAPQHDYLIRAVDAFVTQLARSARDRRARPVRASKRSSRCSKPSASQVVGEQELRHLGAPTRKSRPRTRWACRW